MNDSNTGIADARFIAQLQETKSLKTFLFEERVAINASLLPSIDLGALNALTYNRTGPVPSNDEWTALDAKLSALTSLLDENLRWRLRTRELGFFLKTLPIIFLVLSAFVALFYMLFPSFFGKDSADSPLRAACFLVPLFLWTIFQGAMGACAFIGVSAASRTIGAKPGASRVSDALDLTNRHLLTVRIILGAVFAFLLCLTISYSALEVIRDSILESNAPAPDIRAYATIVAPFLFGFSTNLVLAVLSRLIEVIKTFFGITKTSSLT